MIIRTKKGLFFSLVVNLGRVSINNEERRSNKLWVSELMLEQILHNFKIKWKGNILTIRYKRRFLAASIGHVHLTHPSVDTNLCVCHSVYVMRQKYSYAKNCELSGDIPGVNIYYDVIIISANNESEHDNSIKYSIKKDKIMLIPSLWNRLSPKIVYLPIRATLELSK